MSVNVATAQLLFEVYIRTTPERLWQALTDGSISKHYYFGSLVESDWKLGSSYQNVNAEGVPMLTGTVIAADPPRLLKQTFNCVWMAEAERPPESTVTWEITRIGDARKLTLLHEGLELGSAVTESFREGWSQILSGLKTYLETGQALELPPM